MRPLLPAVKRIYGLALDDLLDMPAVDRAFLVRDFVSCLDAQALTTLEVTDGSTG